jgi:hypothetical protein
MIFSFVVVVIASELVPGQLDSLTSRLIFSNFLHLRGQPEHLLCSNNLSIVMDNAPYC